MKIGTISKIAILGGALIAPTYADKVKLEQLPADLQAKIRAQTGGARIEDIDRDVRNGRTTYEVAFKNAQGQNTELVFEDTSNNSAASATAASGPVDSRKIKYDELPVPVRRVADAQINGGEVNDVEREVHDGKVTYGIGFKGPNGTGPQRELVLDSEGNVLRGRRQRVAATTAGTAAGTSTAAASSTANGNTTTVSSRTIAYSELPQNVRSVAEAHLNKGNVERVDRQHRNGETEYFINFRKDDGQYQQMLIASDGRILSNQLVSAAAGSSAVAQTGATTSSAPVAQAAQYASVASPVPMKNSVVVDRSTLPAEVRRVLRDETRNGNVEEIVQGDWSGKPVYQIAFTDESKRYVELQVDQNGQVIYDPRSHNTTSTPAVTPGTKSGNVLQNLGRALLNGNQQ